MDKGTKWFIDQMYSDHKKQIEKKYYMIENHETYIFMSFEA